MTQMTDEQIKEAIKYEYVAIQQWQILCKEKVDVHKENIKELQKQCSHIREHYYPDPSGNNDSCYVCDVCGKER